MDRPLALKATSVSGSICTVDAGAAEGLRAQSVLTTTVDGVEILILVRAVAAHTAVANWGVLDDKPFRFTPGTPLHVATGYQARLPRWLGEGFRKGDYAPKPISPRAGS